MERSFVNLLNNNTKVAARKCSLFQTMKFILFFAIFVLTSVVWSQKSYTYYLMGRPMSIERNNALMTIGLEHKIKFDFAGNDVIELKGIEYFVNYNDSISMVIAATKLGEDWLNGIYSKTDQEEIRQNAVREIVRKNKCFDTASHDLFQPIILLKKLKGEKNEKYKIYVVGQLKVDESRKFNTHLIFRYNKKKKKMILKSHKVGPLPFTLPQNGLI